MDELIKESFYNQVLELFQNAKRKVSSAVNMTMVYSYYEAGRMIVEEEQNGKQRAEYGKAILKELSECLTESLGKGLIATDLGFSTEAIENGVNGYKVKLGSIQDFVDKIRMLWNSQTDCKKVGANARKDYEKKYMLEDNYNQLMEIYESLVTNQ